MRMNRDLACEGTILNLYKDTVRLPNGEVQVWDYVEHKRGGGSAVVPVLPDGRLLLVRQYRPANDEITLELPAGARDAQNEDPLETATRELEEETGYHAGKMTKLCRIREAGAWCNAMTEIYLAQDLTPVGAQNLDDAEEIQVVKVDLEAVLADIRAGIQTDAKTVAGILAYSQTINDTRHHAKVQFDYK